MAEKKHRRGKVHGLEETYAWQGPWLAEKKHRLGKVYGREET